MKKTLFPYRFFVLLSRIAAVCSIIIIICVSCGRHSRDNDADEVDADEPTRVVVPESVNVERVADVPTVSFLVAAVSDSTGCVGIDVRDKDIRQNALEKSIKAYNSRNENKITLTGEQLRSLVADPQCLGISFEALMSGNFDTSDIDNLTDLRANAENNHLNIKIKALRSALSESNDTALVAEVKSGDAICVKAGKDVSYNVISGLFDILQINGMGKFTIMTDLKTE